MGKARPRALQRPEPESPGPAYGLREGAVGVMPQRLPPQRLSPCEPSLTSSPGRVPPRVMATQRSESRRTQDRLAHGCSWGALLLTPCFLALPLAVLPLLLPHLPAFLLLLLPDLLAFLPLLLPDPLVL